MNVKKQALGRGLSALLAIPENEDINFNDNASTVVGSIASIPVDSIEANPFQPRTEFEEQALNELSISIKHQGIIQPITVRKIGHEKYQLISGERRLRASKLAGLEEIPAYIRIATDSQMLEMALVENIQRENLNAIEVALSYQALIDECKLTQEQMSEKVGKNRTTITNYLRLLKLPAEVQLDIHDDKISMGHARALITLDNIDQQLVITKQIVEKGLSVREVEKMVRAINNPEKKKVKNSANALPENYNLAKNVLKHRLSSKIEIKRNNRGRGNIVISFISDKDFDRILDLLK
ncbi:MAG: ParB/RepB/Spo0J family partition protein [Bacteroidetes bacterium]|nr:ParB/RepB/Spo0J family partition protein [Bacteroidota bacterium]